MTNGQLHTSHAFTCYVKCMTHIKACDVCSGPCKVCSWPLANSDVKCDCIRFPSAACCWNGWLLQPSVVGCDVMRCRLGLLPCVSDYCPFCHRLLLCVSWCVVRWEMVCVSCNLIILFCTRHRTDVVCDKWPADLIVSVADLTWLTE